MKTIYYKIITGYGPEDYIQIVEGELEKAYYAFLTKKDAIYSGGPVRGSEILKIQVDFHRTFGWNRGYKLTADDYAQINFFRIEENALKISQNKKDRVNYLISKGRENEIGSGVRIPELESGSGVGVVGGMVKELSAKFKIK